MADFPSFNDLFRIARDEALIQNSSLTLAILQRAGSDANALIASGVAVGDEVVGQLIRVAGSLFLDSANGPDLDRLVYDRYQLTRKPAAPAVGTVELTLPVPAVAGFSIPVGANFQTTDGITFLATQQVTFPTGSSGPVSVPVQSALAGSNQQASVGTINSWSGITGAPGNMVATNTSATAGAADAEDDDGLRIRAKNFWTTSEKGTLAAIQNGALAVPGVLTATAFDVVDSDGSAARFVQLVIADQFTLQLVNSTVIPAAYQTQSDQLTANVQTALLDVRAAGIQVNVVIAVVELLGVTLGLRFRAGVDPTQSTQQAQAAIVAYVNALAPGQPFVPADAEAQLSIIPGLVILGGEVQVPEGIVQPSPLEVLRTSLGLVTISS